MSDTATTLGMSRACYKCQYRGEVPGSAHSSCKHPDAPKPSPMIGLMAALSGGHTPPMKPNPDGIKVKGHEAGIRGGWFGWPMNFDPTWLLECTGFIAKEGSERAAQVRSDE